MNLLTAHFRFYEELSDFLPPERRKVRFSHQFMPGTAVKDIVESLGVPHTEVDLILVNGQSVDFRHKIKDKDNVSVYPVFETIDITPVTKLRPKPLRNTRFILDVHLGKLARYLRLLGFDTFYDTQYSDSEIIAVALKQKRIILTRDVGLLKNKKVTHGYFLRETNPKKQVQEILKYFDLHRRCRPFTRCLECNGEIINIPKEHSAVKKAPFLVKQMQHDFYQCRACLRLYWQGTHYDKLAEFVSEVIQK